MQKAQVFSLETNSSVRNRLTHTLEVADVGRTLGRAVASRLQAAGHLDPPEVEVLQTIVENACLIHDLGNPPFGHFGEAAVKNWFTTQGKEMIKSLKADLFAQDSLQDFQNFDGNPQGFRIVTKLHNEIDEYGLNLTAPTLLAAVKYPSVGSPDPKCTFPKKIGIFHSERPTYEHACALLNQKQGSRYFLAYLMELADDLCYSTADIADGFEKRITNSREFKEEYKKIAAELEITDPHPLPDQAIEHFSTQVSINLAREIIKQSADYFVNNLDAFLAGTARPLAESTAAGRTLEILTTFARRHIYTFPEAHRIEIAGSTIMSGLLDHYSRLLRLSQENFRFFLEKDAVPKKSGLDLEWRIYKQLSRRMLKCYKHFTQKNQSAPLDEWLLRSHLIVDFVSGLTDASARDFYQNFMGISL
jgi:dGTPase